MFFIMGLAFILCCLLTLILTPYVMRLAYVVRAIDQPDARKTHTKPTPRLGGVAVFFSFFIVFAILLITHCFDGTWIVSYQGMACAVALLFITMLGVLDDIHPLSPLPKFLVQLILSTVIYFVGIRISIIENPLHAGSLDVGILSYPLTVLWIIGITNALNLIDGLDGLAVGVGTIALLAMIPLALVNGDLGTTFLIVLMAGSLVGFLRYNFNPAKIFMGDSGSLFMGFMIAILSIRSSTKSTAAAALSVPVIALGIPIVETLLSMLRRFMSSHSDRVCISSRLKMLFLPDRRHIHHMLMDRGFSHRKTVILLYMIGLLLGIMACSMIFISYIGASVIFAGVGVAVVFGIRHLRYEEMSMKGVFKRFRRSKVL